MAFSAQDIPDQSGRTVVITGGNSGLGFEVARRLVAEGARVVLSGRNAATVERAAFDLGPAALGVVADVGRLGGIDRLVAATRAFAEGRLDVLFANAGTAAFGPVASTTEAQWDELMNVNLKGV